MSDPHGTPDGPTGPHSLAERALDLLVFAPTGAVLSALEDVPGMAARGRALIEQEVRNAHVVGQFALEAGQRRLARSIDRLTSAANRTTTEPAADVDAAGAGEGDGDEAAAPPESPEAPAGPPPFTPQSPAPAAAGPADLGRADTGGDGATLTADLAIPGYDALSASQVVRRLDGLGPDELAAVFRHETAHRGRRTILHRAQQLLGPATPPPEG